MTDSSSSTTEAASRGLTAKDHPLQGLTIEATLSDPAVSTSTRSGSPSQHDDDDDNDDFENYNIDIAIVAWDQISELTQEITSSLMAKQASMLCKRFRKEEALLNISASQSKKRRVLCDLSSSSKKPVEDVVVVTSDEESHSEPQHGPQVQGLPDELSAQVGRIGRMSKLVLEIEYCQRELRNEMLAMSDHQL